MNTRDGIVARRVGRRQLLRAMLATSAVLAAPRLMAATAASGSAAAGAHFPFGPVTPTAEFPHLPLLTHQGREINATSLLPGHVTALQLMFTGCSATCPIQGALFSALQRSLGTDVPRVQLLSLSIDPLSDTPAALARWLARFDAKPGWTAAAPRQSDLDRLKTFLRGDESQSAGFQPRPNDAHTAQVYIIDRAGRLAYRSADFPPAARMAETLRQFL